MPYCHVFDYFCDGYRYCYFSYCNSFGSFFSVPSIYEFEIETDNLFNPPPDLSNLKPKICIYPRHLENLCNLFLALIATYPKIFELNSEECEYFKKVEINIKENLKLSGEKINIIDIMQKTDERFFCEGIFGNLYIIKESCEKLEHCMEERFNCNKSIFLEIIYMSEEQRKKIVNPHLTGNSSEIPALIDTSSFLKRINDNTPTSFLKNFAKKIANGKIVDISDKKDSTKEERIKRMQEIIKKQADEDPENENMKYLLNEITTQKEQKKQLKARKNDEEITKKLSKIIQFCSQLAPQKNLLEDYQQF